MTKAKLAVAVSGGGRSLENFLLRQNDPDSCFEVVAVISSRPDCRAVELANAVDLPVFVDSFPRHASLDLTDRLRDFCLEHGVEWLALAGFIRVFPMLSEFKGRVVNIHPALLPDFGGPGMYGDAVHQAVMAARSPESGATVHFVNERYDEGQIIAQSTVAIAPTDDWKSLKSKVFEIEKILYPKVINQLISGQLPLPDGNITIM